MLGEEEPGFGGPEDEGFEFEPFALQFQCPFCGSPNVTSAVNPSDFEDVTVALCEDCRSLWCAECGCRLEPGETCGHWEICEGCGEDRDEEGDCGVETLECPYVLEWVNGRIAEAFERTCSWCGGAIPEGSEVVAVGAKLRGGIEVAPGGDGTGFYIPIDLGGRRLVAVVTGMASEAREAGNDLLFITCGEECAGVLCEALEAAQELIERAELN